MDPERSSESEVAWPGKSRATCAEVALSGACAGALLIGTLFAAAGLAGGAAVCGGWAVLFVPVTFGLSVPLAASFCAGVGLWAGAIWGALAGAGVGAFLFAVAFYLGIEGRLSWCHPGLRCLRHALLGFFVTALAAPPCAAIGSVLGICSGAFLGLVAGSLLAPFTLAMSLPIFTVACAILGAAIDAAAGAALGACLGALAVWQKDKVLQKLEQLRGLARDTSQPLRLAVANLICPTDLPRQISAPDRHLKADDDEDCQSESTASDANESTNDGQSDSVAPMMLTSRSLPDAPTKSNVSSPKIPIQDFQTIEQGATGVIWRNKAWCPVTAHLNQSPRYRGTHWQPTSTGEWHADGSASAR